MGKKWLDFGGLDLICKVTPALWMSNFDKKKACLQPTKWWSLAKLYVLYHWDNLKNWFDFGDLDLIFKVTTL